MLGLPNIGLTKTLRDTTAAVSTTMEAVNRTANTLNLTAKLAESRMQYEVQKQSIIQAKRLEELQHAEVTQDEEGNWNLFDSEPKTGPKAA